MKTMAHAFSAESRLALDPGAELIVGPAGEVLVRVRREVSVLRARAELIEPLVALAKRAEKYGAVVTELGRVHGDAVVRAAIDELRTAGVLAGGRPAAAAPPRLGTIGVAGDGKIAERVRQLLEADGWAIAALTMPHGGTRGYRPIGRAGPGAPSPMPLDGLAAVVCAAESGLYADALALGDACLAAGVAALFVTVEPDAVSIGPLVVPGLSPCLGCTLEARLSGDGRPTLPVEALEALRLGSLDDADALPLGKVSVDVASAIREAIGSARPTALLSRVRRVARRGGWVAEREAGSGGCARCAAAGAARGPAALAAEVSLSQLGTCGVDLCGGDDPEAVRHVGVIGGGSAGYLTALALRARLPHLRVTLLESPHIPIIGVGEATTTDLVAFLRDALRVDERRLYREVRPTWKLGIRFFWGEPGERAFNYPFVGQHLLEALASGDLDRQSFATMLMTQGKGPVVRDDGGSPRSLLQRGSYAYHLDNAPFVAFLEALAKERGIERQSCTIARVARSSDGAVEALETDDGRRWTFDLYVDCSGFRSLLLRETLGSPFISYAASLFDDAAVVGEAPHGGVFGPYTLAESFSTGWCWKIPTQREDHRGYVFSSAYQSPDRAEAELRSRVPGIGATRLVRFRSGRHEHFFHHNVVAIGNAYAFVEPLESTALHMIVYQVDQLVRSFPLSKRPSPAQRDQANRRIGAHWDYLRDFLAVHFRFNEKYDTPYWRACRNDADIRGAQPLLDLYRQAAPLSARADRDVLEQTLTHDGLFHLFGWDNVLLGQGVPARILKPERPRPAFTRWVETIAPSLVARALPHREALEAYGELLERGLVSW